MQLVGEVLKKATQFFQDKGVDEPRLSAQWLLAHALNMKRLDLYIHFDRPISEAELVLYRSFVTRRVLHEPVAYIIGMQPFHGIQLKVDSSVLIPRPETEELVDLVLEHIKQKPGIKGLDLCCGSGAIAIALKKYCSNVEIHGSDICPKALELAKLNAIANHQKVIFHQHDLLAGLDEKFDFVVCNPPYIANHVIHSLQKQVLLFEPHLALDGGNEGVDFYKRLATELPSILNSGARVFFEIGFDQGEVIKAMFNLPPFYGAIVKKDLNQKSRFVIIDYIDAVKGVQCSEI